MNLAQKICLIVGGSAILLTVLAPPWYGAARDPNLPPATVGDYREMVGTVGEPGGPEVGDAPIAFLEYAGFGFVLTGPAGGSEGFYFVKANVFYVLWVSLALGLLTAVAVGAAGRIGRWLADRRGPGSTDEAESASPTDLDGLPPADRPDAESPGRRYPWMDAPWWVAPAAAYLLVLPMVTLAWVFGAARLYMKIASAGQAGLDAVLLGQFVIGLLLAAVQAGLAAAYLRLASWARRASAAMLAVNFVVVAVGQFLLWRTAGGLYDRRFGTFGVAYVVIAAAGVGVAMLLWKTGRQEQAPDARG